jgi:hypothetical protein
MVGIGRILSHIHTQCWWGSKPSREGGLLRSVYSLMWGR